MKKNSKNGKSDSITDDKLLILNMVYGRLEQLYMYFYINKNKDIIIDYRTGDIVLDFRQIPNRNYAIHRREEFFLVKRNVIVVRDEKSNTTVLYNKNCEQILVINKLLWTTDVKDFKVLNGCKTIIALPLGNTKNKITTVVVLNLTTGKVERIHEGVTSLHYKDSDNITVNCIENGKIKCYIYKK